MSATDLLSLISYAIETETIDDLYQDDDVNGNNTDNNSNKQIVRYGIISLFKKIDLVSMDVRKSDLLQKHFLLKCIPDKKLAAKAIMNIWIDQDINFDKMHTFTYMITQNLYDITQLAFIRDLLPTSNETIDTPNGKKSGINLYTHYMGLINGDADPNLIGVCEILEELYSLLDYEAYVQLFNLADLEENNIMMDYFTKKMEQLSPMAAIPGYLIPKRLTWEENPELPRNRDLELDTDRLSHDEQMKIYNDPNDRMDERAVNAYRILGPVLLIAGTQLDPSNDYICNHFGGCRMFTCNCLITTEDDQEDLIVNDDITNEDWFTGNCMQCHKAINKRIYAVRMPRLTGGWTGEYCSFQCLNKQARMDSANDIILSMISYLERQFLEIGILDRQFSHPAALINIGDFSYGEERPWYEGISQ
jgi:hypothetical protein